MYVQLPLRKLLNALHKSLHSIDIRSAVKKHDSGWLDLLTAIRISARSVTDVKTRHAKLLNTSPCIHADPFRVLFAAIPLSEIDLILGELLNGYLTLEGEKVFLPQALAIDQTQSAVQRWQEIVRPWETEQWAGAYYPFGTRSASFQEPELVGAVLKSGWRSPESATASLLELDKQRIFSQTISLFIYVEMPAQIKLVSTDALSFAIQVKAESKLSNLTLYWDTDSEIDAPKKLDIHNTGHENGFELLSTDQIPAPDDSAILSCWLSHDDLPVIDTISERLGDAPSLAQPNKQKTDYPFHSHAGNLTPSTVIERKIFISHINEEASLATSLKQAIEESFFGRCTVFVSSHPMDLPAGTRWLEEISDALESAGILIVLCSPSSIGRPWINFEAGCCWSRKIPIVPICHSGQQRSYLPPPLSSLQALELEDGMFSKHLILALSTHLGIEAVSEFDCQKMNAKLVKASARSPKDDREEQNLLPQLKDGAYELARVLERQESQKRVRRILKQALPSPLKIEFNGENSVEWVERPHPALPMQRVQHKVYGVVIHNSASHDVDNVTIELERVEDLTDQASGPTCAAPYLGHKLSFERNAKTTMKFSPDLRDRVRLISYANGIFMTNSFKLENNDRFIDARHQHRIYLKVTGDGVKPSKASFIVRLDREGMFSMIRDNDAPTS